MVLVGSCDGFLINEEVGRSSRSPFDLQYLHERVGRRIVVVSPSLAARQSSNVTGLGWERVRDALGPVVRDTDGRVFTLSNLPQLVGVRPFSDLVGLAS